MKALIFDLDGTLVDTVYAHVLAWQQTLGKAGLIVTGQRIHRLIGMSGDLLIRSAARELGREIGSSESKELQLRHGELFEQLLPEPRLLPGARELIFFLQDNSIPFGIATSGRRPKINPSLDKLGLDPKIAVIERRDVAYGKPEPDLFEACRQRLGVNAEECYVVGDAVWDLFAARRIGILGLALKCGGYGADELYRAGAYRVFRDPADLHNSLDELGMLY